MIADSLIALFATGLGKILFFMISALNQSKRMPTRNSHLGCRVSHRKSLGNGDGIILMRIQSEQKPLMTEFAIYHRLDSCEMS